MYVNTTDSRRRQRVAVIGAGVSGLTTTRWLLAEGLTPVVFEQADEIGGLWNYHEEQDDGGSLAYRSLRTNTSKQTMAFSDFPFPASLPDFPLRAAVLQYLHDYTEHFSLHAHIQLNTVVESATPTNDERWLLRIRSGERITADVFDALVVCSGRDRESLVPCYPGVETFQGSLLHSSHYKAPEPYAGKDVVVVGLGSSGADIAVEVSQTARHTYLSTANGGWVFPRTIGGRPWDHNLTRLSALVPYRLRMRVLRQLVLAEYRRMGLDGRMSAWGIPEPTFDLWRARFTPSSDLLPRIASGAIAVKPNIARLDAHEVVFTDETRAPVDAVILCTGYAMRFPFFAESLVMATGSDIALYRHVFHPDWPNLAFIGLVIVGGPLLPVAEMQARWVARVFSSTVALPSSVQMRAEIRRRRTRHARRSPYPMRVQLIEYMDELAELIGVRPRWWRHPRLIATLMAGPPLAAQYRLEGDGRFERVATFIQAQQRRP